MTLEEFKKKAAKIPDTPGVYFFLGKRKELLYIGKATSLRSRVRSYFSNDLPATRGQLIVSMVQKARTIDWRQTDSVLEALLLEANLIRTHKPPHNTDLKDDKSFNHVVITKENFPRVLLVRGKNLAIEFPQETRLFTFGPFPHGAQLKEALRIIRKIFPYRDTCVPCEQPRRKVGAPTKASGQVCKPCFNRHIGLCPGVCSGEISKTEYRKIIRRIALLFQGKKSTLLKNLERDMKLAAEQEAFEEAARLRGQMFALKHIQDISLIKNEYRWPQDDEAKNSVRIEAYDAAHLGGKSAVGVMTVVEDGVAMPAEYRKFILRRTKPGDDPGALREILSRRLNHPEWPMPRIIVVDGSVAQLNAAHQVLSEFGIEIPIVGVTKDEKHRPRALQGDKNIIKQREKEILLANAEAHRFAIGFHRKKSRQNLLLE